MINVYTDGSCNLMLKKAGIGIYFCNKEISKKLVRTKLTNNVAELCAIIEAFDHLKIPLSENVKIVIHTDSNYAILCASSYGKKCAEKNWPSSIPNVELVKTIYTKFQNHKNVSLQYVKAHTNRQDVHSLGNARADMLAREAMKK
jgi:ribonuclease HI